MRRAVFILLAGAMAAVLLRPGPWLVLEEVESGTVVTKIPLKWNEKFKICYMHSVDIKPVCEIFSLKKKGGIFLEEMYFVMFGAGMGHWEGHGHVVSDGKWTWIKEIEKPLGSFVLRVGSPGVDHMLTAGEKQVHLTDLAEGKMLEVKMETHPAAFSLIWKLRSANG